MNREEWLLAVAMWCACLYVGLFASALSHAWSQSRMVVRWRPVRGVAVRWWRHAA